MKKKILALFLCCILLMGLLSGCSKDNTEVTETPAVTEAATSAATEATEALTEAPEATEAPIVTPEATEAPTEAPEATEAPTETPTATEALSEPAAENVIFVDSAGREVEVPAEITRVVPSGPLSQIVLFSLAADKFVGLSSNWSDDAVQYLDSKYLELPILGQFYGSGELNMEEVLLADPQIIIDIGEPKGSIVEDMDGIQAQLGIPAVHITATLESMPEAYRMLGKLLGMEEEAERYALYCETVYTKTLDIMDEVGENKPTLLYCLGDTGLNVLATGSFHAEVINLLSNNIAVVDEPSSKGSGNEVDMEQIMNWDPQIIMFAPGSVYSTVADDPTWKGLQAIKNNDFVEVPEGPYNWMGSPPSVNRYLGLIWMTQLLYPDIAQYDLRNEVKEYYKNFYHCDLTDEQYDALVANSVGK